MKQPTKDAAALDRAQSDLKAAFEETDRLAAEKRQLESQLAARFVEIVSLTRIAQRAESERDVATGERYAAIAQAGAMKAELEAAVAAHRDEVERLETAQVALAASHEARVAELVAAHADEVGRLKAEMDTIRQAAGRRAQAALTAVAQAAPWRWLPGRVRASLLAPLVRRTELLDGDWYAGRYEDVGVRGLDPVRHFLSHGAKEGRFPNEDAAFANGDDRTGGQGQTAR